MTGEFLEVSDNLFLADFPQSAHEIEGNLSKVIGGAQIFDHAQPQPGSHFGIGQRPVKTTVCWQPFVVDQRLEAVIGRMGINPPSRKQRAAELLAP